MELPSFMFTVAVPYKPLFVIPPPWYAAVLPVMELPSIHVYRSCAISTEVVKSAARICCVTCYGLPSSFLP